MTALALIFTLSAIGISETAYLIKKRIFAEKPVCPIGEDCTTVLESKFNKIFFIHNDLLGLLGYIAISTIAAFLVIGIMPISVWNILLKIFVGFAAIFSAILIFLQWKVIKAWCFWCILSACTIWCMGIIILLTHL